MLACAKNIRGRSYEIQVQEHLRDADEERATDVYLWHQCPEPLLEEIGLIADWRQYRLARVAGRNPLPDTGIDLVVSHRDQNRRGIIQCKAYSEEAVLSQGCLTGFFREMMNACYYDGFIGRSATERTYGAVYHSAQDISGVLKDIPPYVPLRYVRLPYEDRFEQQFRSQAREDETAYALYPDQAKGLEALRAWWQDPTKKRGFVQMPCGTGKTVLAGHWLSVLSEDQNIRGCIFFVPLREHAQQSYDRLAPFVPDWAKVLVDMDGCRDIEEIRRILVPSKKALVVATYRSADVVRQLMEAEAEDETASETAGETAGEPGWLAIIDEFHNLSVWDLGLLGDNHSDMASVIGSAERVVGLSATPRIYDLEEDEVLGSEGHMGEVIYRMDWNEAIRTGRISDYLIWVPSIQEGTRGEAELEEIAKTLGIAEVARPLEAKVHFVLHGMMETGSRRCIIYMESGPGMIAAETARAYQEMIETMAGWFGVHAWVGTVLSNNTPWQRKEALREFEDGPVVAEDQRPRLLFLLSVRILDEAIDIPACDSVFFAGPSTCKVRSIQRLSRMLRRHPGKVRGNAFVWCSRDCDEQAHLFSALKENDPRLTEKVGIITGSYERVASGRATEASVGEAKRLIDDYIMGIRQYQPNMFEQRAMARAQELVAWSRAHENRLPRSGTTKSDFTEEEKTVGTWLLNYKNNRMKYDSVNALLNTAFGNRWKYTEEEKFMARAQELVAWSKENNNRLPRSGTSKTDFTEDEKKVGLWLREYQKKLIKYESVDALLTTTFGNQWRKYTMEEKAMAQAQELVAWSRANDNRLPRTGSKKNNYTEKEKSLGIWLSNYKSEMKYESVNALLNTTFGNIKQTEEEKVMARAKELIAWSKANQNRLPRSGTSKTDFTEDEKSIGLWLLNYKNKMTYDSVNSLLNKVFENRWHKYTAEEKAMARAQELVVWSRMNENRLPRKSSVKSDYTEEENLLGKWLYQYIEMMPYNSVNQILNAVFGNKWHLKPRKRKSSTSNIASSSKQ